MSNGNGRPFFDVEIDDVKFYNHHSIINGKLHEQLNRAHEMQAFGDELKTAINRSKFGHSIHPVF